MQGNAEVEGIDWSADRIFPVFQAPEHLTVYDIRAASHDVQLSVTTLAGLINRPQPHIYLLSNNDDAFWLQEVFSSIPQSTSPLTNDAILDALLTTYQSRVQGMIIYNPDFSESINIATMLAGQRNGVVVSPTQAQKLQQGSHQLPILDDLRKYTWHSRLDAYLWAKDHLLQNASSQLVAGLPPTIVSGLRSFLVATRAFIYWLDSRYILPHPQQRWLSQRCLMKQILTAFPPGATHLGWFIDEGTGVSLASQAAKQVFATDFFTNLEVWTSIQPAAPLPTRQAIHESRAQESTVSSPAKVSISFTMSEGDNLQYNQHRMLHLWRDPARGSLPIGWTISPMLLQATPRMAAYYIHTTTPNDELIAGPSGAGYILPSRWPKARISSFLQDTGRLMQQMNLTIVQVLDSNYLQSIPLALRALFTGSGMALIDRDLQKRFVQELSPFGIQGILSGAGQRKPSWRRVSGSVVYQNLGLARSVNQTVALIRAARTAHQQHSGQDTPLYLNVYVLAWNMGPSDLKEVLQQLGSEYEAVTPSRLLTMLAEKQEESAFLSK